MQIKDINLFEFATRNGLRFPSSKGELDAERLWQVPLRGKTPSDDFNLDAIAKAAKKASQAAEESFVDTDKKTAAQTRLEVAFAVVVHVIATKKAEEAADKKRAEDKVKRAKILEAIEAQENGQLQKMTPADLRKMLAELGD